MNYWMTTHTPPNTEDLDNYQPSGIWLPDGREKAGDRIGEGDKVLIYQTESGTPEVRRIRGRTQVIPRSQGKGGIIAIARITGDLEELEDSEPTEYADGTDTWWKWHAETEITSMNGFVPRHRVNRILNYDPDYSLHGFGDYHSGLKWLDEEEYKTLVQEFKKRTQFNWHPHDQRGESRAHRELKEFVASDPARILGEDGLITYGTEYGFPSNDRADIVFEDKRGRIIGAEIELNVISNPAGILQAIKYRYMLALTENRENSETRAFLIANLISDEMKDICDRYGVEWFEIQYD
jgi:hypothetical protein